jgi:3'-5' exoribonuclease
MKSPYVSELEPNQLITGVFLVQSKDIRQKKTGDPYLSLMLGDRTGDLDSKMWDNAAEVMDTFDRDDFVKVRGMVQVHQNRLQLSIHKMQRVDTAEIDPADYFPASARDPDEMFAEATAIVGGMTNPHLRALCGAMLADPDIAKRYRIAPAAKTIHHAYLGGLMEHVLSMCHIARTLAAHYKHVDLDLLLTGVLLHDIGKIYELTYDRSFGYSTEGHLLGHIHIGVRMVHDKICNLPDFPPRLRTLVEHMMLSHHGELEFGSPKLPLFAEALLLHHIDNLDSKIEAMRVAEERDRQVEGHLTSFSSALDRSVLKKEKYLNGEAAAVHAGGKPHSEKPQENPAASSAAPVRVPKPPPPPPRPPNLSPFAEQLKQALVKDPSERH